MGNNLKVVLGVRAGAVVLLLLLAALTGGMMGGGMMGAGIFGTLLALVFWFLLIALLVGLVVWVVQRTQR